MEQDGEEPVADDGAVELVGVAGAHALAVSGPALAEAQLGVLDGVGAGDGGVGGVGVLGLTDEGGEAGEAELIGIDGAAEGGAQLLHGGQGQVAAVEHGVEVGNDAADALAEFALELFFGGGGSLGRVGLRGLLRGGRRGGLLLGGAQLSSVSGASGVSSMACWICGAGASGRVELAGATIWACNADAERDRAATAANGSKRRREERITM